jgi:putative tryptophan/tyrosine transport system substrate-binding protein
MDRRKFMQVAGGAMIASPLPALAQQAAGLPLVAVLLPSPEDRAVRLVAALRDGLKQAGLTEGTHYVLTLRFANGDIPQLPKLAKELEALGPRVFVAAANAATAVHQQAPNAPLVFTGVAVDVIALGWAESYARPGGMVTGNVQNAMGGEEAITAKRIGLFKELMPNLTRLGMIGFSEGLLTNLEHNGLRKASSRLGLRFRDMISNILNSMALMMLSLRGCAMTSAHSTFRLPLSPSAAFPRWSRLLQSRADRSAVSTPSSPGLGV